MGELTSKLANVVVDEAKVFDEKRTVMFITAEPINLEKLKASLAKDDTDDGLLEFQPRFRLTIAEHDRVTGMSLWIDGFPRRKTSGLTRSLWRRSKKTRCHLVTAGFLF